MKIAVLVKQVFDKDSNINISADGSLSNREDLTLATNECDSYALEEALQIKEQKGGEVIVLSVGSDSVLSVIKDGLAKGAEHLDFDSIKRIIASWLVTIPAGAAFTVLFYVLLRIIFGV